MNNKMAVNTYLSIITLNVNRGNAPFKRHTVAEWITKQDPYICCLKDSVPLANVQKTSRNNSPIVYRWQLNT